MRDWLFLFKAEGGLSPGGLARKSHDIGKTNVRLLEWADNFPGGFTLVIHLLRNFTNLIPHISAMTLSPKAKSIHDQINSDDTKLGDLRKIAKEIRKDHNLAMELWSTGDFFPQQLAILIMDKKQLNEHLVNQLCAEILEHDEDRQNRLADWLMANQLSKNKATIALMMSWENSTSPIQRRLYWYYQARLRWVGQPPPENTPQLLKAIEKNMASEAPQVQWAMNFTAGWIGVHDKRFRSQCIDIGEKIGLYKDEVVAKNCTPNYLPEFIRIEAAKLN